MEKIGLGVGEWSARLKSLAALAPELANDVLHQCNAKDFLAILCLAPGVTMESAEAGLDAITRRLDELDTSSLLRTDKGRRITLLSAGTSVPISRKFKPPKPLFICRSRRAILLGRPRVA